MKKKDSKYYWIVLMFVAAVFTFTESSDLYNDIKATTWPTSTGNLERTYEPAVVLRSMPEYGPFFEPLRSRRIFFSFEVNGTKYTSSNKSFGVTLSEEIELINPDDMKHPKVKVYFNPLDPNEAVLMPGPKAINICFVALGAISLFWIMKQIT